MAGPGRAVPPEERGVGIVFQDYALFPHLTVADNVAFGLPRAARRSRVEPVLELVGLGGFGPRYPHELSGGQQQRVALARALAPAPALMLLDEPFSNLDADLRAQMRDEVERILRTSGTTAIFVTHDQEEAFTLADRVGVLQAGRIEQLAPRAESTTGPATRFVAEFVGAADFLPGVVTGHGIVTEVGTFANVEQLAPGGRVDVMIRPDDITFVPQADGTGTITRRYFRGSETVYCIRLPSGDRVHSSQPSASVLPTGMRVRAEAHVLHVVALRRGQPPSPPGGRGEGGLSYRREDVSRISSTTGSSPTATSASAGTAASCHIDSAVRSQISTASVLSPKGRNSSVAGISFMVSTKTSTSAVSSPPRMRGRCTRRSAEPARAPSDPRRVVEARRDLAEARVHRLQAHREEAHDVGEDEAGRRAGEEQAERAAEDALERGHQRVVGPGERQQHAHRDHRARQRVAHRGELGRHADHGGVPWSRPA